MKPQRFEAYAIFSDADGRCDCNEVTPYPVEFQVVDGFTERKVMVIDLEEFGAMESEATSDAELIKRLNASLGEAQAERDRLREALAGLMKWEVYGVLEHCDGNKCREPWCAGCCGEDVAEENVERLHADFAIARKALEGGGE